MNQIIKTGISYTAILMFAFSFRPTLLGQYFNEKAPIAKENKKEGSLPQNAVGDSMVTYQLQSGLKVTIENKRITICSSSGKMIGTNTAIIRGMDEDPNCISEGFQDLVSKGIYFTVEQQVCASEYFIDEYITFKYSKKDGKVWLHQFGLEYSSRKDQEMEITDKIFTEKQFGKISFENVNVDNLYSLLDSD